VNSARLGRRQQYSEWTRERRRQNDIARSVSKLPAHEIEQRVIAVRAGIRIAQRQRMNRRRQSFHQRAEEDIRAVEAGQEDQSCVIHRASLCGLVTWGSRVAQDPLSLATSKRPLSSKCNERRAE
jgi:hypothetical protein